MRRTLAARSLMLLAAASVAGLGCTKSAEPPARQAPATPTVLKLFVDDQSLVQQIIRVKGEWKARSGIELEIRETSGTKPLEEEGRGTDAIIYAPADLGLLVESGVIRELPADWLNREEFHKSDLFDPCGLAACRWGEQIFAVPFGSPVYVLMYRRDLFERFKLEPPRTWAEYQHVADTLNAHGSEIPGLEYAAIEEVGGKMLLARAAAYAKHPDYYATLFDKETMAPLINGPPFVRALEEMIAAKNPKSIESMATNLVQIRRAIFEGRFAMAITRPTAAAMIFDRVPSSASVSAQPAKDRATRIAAVTFAELPGATEVYNPQSKSWAPNPKGNEPGAADRASRVPLLAINGLVGSVTAESKSPEAAFQLLAWLSGDEWGSQICSASPWTTLFRRPQLKQPGRWVESQLSPEAAKQNAQVVATSLSRPQWLTCPQIPGQLLYMLALNEAVHSAAVGKKTASEALNDAAKRWQELTEKFGVEVQRASYIRSLGLEP